MQTPHILFDLRHFGDVALLAIVALFPIVNPLGGAPLFLVMTAGLDPRQRIWMAKAIAINSFLLLVVSALVGAYVLDFFGLSIPAVQLTGGIVVCIIGWSMLNRPDAPAMDARSTIAAANPVALQQRAFYPLTMPLTVGPGSISVAVTLGANPAPGARALIVTAIGHAAGILLLALSIFICYRYAEPLLKRVGPTGTAVFLRLSAFILLCIGVQISWNGLHALVLSGFPALAR